MKRSDRAYQAACVLAALLLIGATLPARDLLLSRRQSLAPEASATGHQVELDSFAMALLLGGFRGPLVMYLWVASEEAKHQEQTEKFLTHTGLIGDLQPQFATIYTHQSWNLAYNISVQYSRPTEKYRWIQEGIRFVEKGNRRIPRNADILAQLGDLHMDKLGDSVENEYYRERFRQDSREQWLDAQQRLNPAQASQWRYVDELEALLADIEAGRCPRTGRVTMPGGLDAWRDRPIGDPAGRHQWPYGVSVFAVAYDYLQQAAFAGTHKHFGRSVMSSRPAIACRLWLKEELELALAAESRLWPIDRLGQALPAPTTAMLADGRAAVEEAAFHCREAQRVGLLAQAIYTSHVIRYPYESDTFTTHLNDVRIKAGLARAGQLRLEGFVELLAARQAGDADGLAEALRKLRTARAEYRDSGHWLANYLATEYRRDPWSSDDRTWGRKPFDLLADQAQRAAAQIDLLLASP